LEARKESRRYYRSIGLPIATQFALGFPLEVLFGSSGAIQHAFVVRGLGFGLDEQALKAARGIGFKSGEVGGQPASMWMGVEILFGPIELEKKREGTPRIALKQTQCLSGRSFQ